MGAARTSAPLPPPPACAGPARPADKWGLGSDEEEEGRGRRPRRVGSGGPGLAECALMLSDEEEEGRGEVELITARAFHRGAIQHLLLLLLVG